MLGKPKERGEDGNSDAPNEGRRNFLKIFGGAAVGAAAALTGNKYFREEQELNKLHELFDGNENSFYYGNKAAGYLLNEMEVENISRVKISGTGHPNMRVTLLRDFLTKHLNSKSGKKYLGVRDIILKEGVYTNDNLRVILQVSQDFMLRNGDDNTEKSEEIRSHKRPI